MTLAFVLAVVVALVFIFMTDHYQDKYSMTLSELLATKKALKTAEETNARLDATIKEYGEDRVRRGDELAEMGGKIAWFMHFLGHVENPPKFFAPMIGHRWRLVSSITVIAIRDMLSEISGDWEEFEAALFTEAERRRVASSKVRPKRVVGRRVAK